MSKEYKLNIQNQVKVPEYLECYVPREGHIWIQKDYSAVEPTVLAKLSGCPRYQELYGPGANPNQDVYLYVGCKFPQFSHFLEHYDPENPTAEGRDACKKAYKGDRAICKEFHLAAAYGAGVNRLYNTLINKEIEIEREDVEIMHQVYWNELFGEVKRYQWRLKQERARRGGWIKNALGRVIGVGEDKVTDILNTMCQSSGHDLLQWDNHFVDQLRRERKIPLYPIINDYHDEMIFECPVEAAKEGMQLMHDTQDMLNDMLGWSIKIKGEPELALNLAAIKCEDYQYTEEEQEYLSRIA